MLATEVIRPDEEPVLKTGDGEQPFVSSSQGTDAQRWSASALMRLKMEVIRIGEEPAWKAGSGQQPLVGSSPTASALIHGPVA